MDCFQNVMSIEEPLFCRQRNGNFKHWESTRRYILMRGEREETDLIVTSLLPSSDQT